MIPKLPLFVILAIFGGGHNGFQFMWTMCAFLSAQVNRSYQNYEKKNMELGTKITQESSMLPRSYLVLILGLWGGGHIGFQVMWTLSAFFKGSSE